MTILDTIVEYKQKEVESTRDLIPIDQLKKHAFFSRKTISLKEFLLNQHRTGIIAEYKRKSPSKGMINSHSSVEEVTLGYSNYGASALSVLTDFNFFGGSADDLIKARTANSIPILRKEFIIDDYQIFEAKALGADAILLIAAILDNEKCKRFSKLAESLGLEVLLEVHEEKEIDRLNEYIQIVGVNNRNLKTFAVDLEISSRLSSHIPGNILKVSESGISSAKDVFYLKTIGFNGFLIGENFMKSPDPVTAFKNFVDSLNDH